MKHLKQSLLALLLCLCIVCSSAFVFRANADFGDFAGDSDYGDDWDNNDSGWDNDDDDDWSRDDDHHSNNYVYVDNSSSGGSSSGGGSGVTSIIIGAVILAIIILVIVSSRKNKGKKPVAPGAQRTAQSQLRPMAEYPSLDPKFDQPELNQRLSNWYVQMQNGWCDGSIESVRPYFSDAYYAQMERQLNQMKQAGRVAHVERISVLGVQFRGFYQSGGQDHIIAEVRSRIVDYTTDKAGNLLSGSKTAEKFMTYEWELTRPTGTMTQAAGAMNVVNCPNCGAALNINATAKCPYCDSVVTVNQHDWVISSIKGLSQRTNG